MSKKSGDPYVVEMDVGRSHRWIVKSVATGKQAHGTTKYLSKEQAQSVCDTKNAAIRRDRGRRDG